MAKCTVNFKVGTFKYRGEPKAEREILNGPLGKQAATKAASSVLAGTGGFRGRYGMSPAQAGKNRAHAIVYTQDYTAMKENAKSNSLLKALHSSGV